MTQGDGHRELGEPVKIVGGAVEGVDDPLEVPLSLGSALLGKDGMMGELGAQLLQDGCLGGTVHLAYEVVAALGLDLQLVDPLVVAKQHLAGGPGGANGDSQGRVHGGAQYPKAGPRERSAY